MDELMRKKHALKSIGQGEHLMHRPMKHKIKKKMLVKNKSTLD